MCAPMITSHVRKVVKLFFSEMTRLCNPALGGSFPCTSSSALVNDMHHVQGTQLTMRGRGVEYLAQRRDTCQPFRSCLSLRRSLTLEKVPYPRIASVAKSGSFPKGEGRIKKHSSPPGRGTGVRVSSHSDKTAREPQAETLPSRMMR